jgi:hypothetical protein
VTASHALELTHASKFSVNCASYSVSLTFGSRQSEPVLRWYCAVTQRQCDLHSYFVYATNALCADAASLDATLPNLGDTTAHCSSVPRLFFGKSPSLATPHHALAVFGFEMFTKLTVVEHASAPPLCRQILFDVVLLPGSRDVIHWNYVETVYPVH